MRCKLKVEDRERIIKEQGSEKQKERDPGLRTSLDNSCADGDKCGEGACSTKEEVKEEPMLSPRENVNGRLSYGA